MKVILEFKFSPPINFIFKSFSINKVASSCILFFCFIDKLYKVLKSNACGVCVKKEFFLSKLNNYFLILYLIESFELTTGIVALFLLSDSTNFFNNFNEKFGLAAS